MSDSSLQADDLITSPQAAYDLLRSVTPESPCPYLPGRLWRSEAYLVEELEGGAYERLLSRGFRRCGRIVYRPACRKCHECRQMRVLVERFQPTRSMRRAWRLNADVSVVVDEPAPSEEKFDLFRSYLDGQHDGTMARSYESFESFLYDSPGETYECNYFLGRRLIGASLLDRCRNGLSSVYMYYDPSFKERSLGTYSILWEVDYCRRLELPYYYLGYYISGCPSMAYKARFRPAQVLAGQDAWVVFP